MDNENQQCYYTIRHRCSAIANHLSRLQYYRSTIYVNARYLRFVLQLCGKDKEEEKEIKKRKKKKKKKSCAYVFVVSIKRHMWHICARIRMVICVCESRVYPHACTRAATKIPRRELHYILYRLYKQSVDVCARARVTFCTRTFGMQAERTFTLRWMQQHVCDVRATRVHARSHAEKYCGDAPGRDGGMRIYIYIVIRISILLNIIEHDNIRYRYSDPQLSAN